MQQHEERIREIMYASAAPVVLMNTYIKTQIKNCSTRWFFLCVFLSAIYLGLYVNKKPSERDIAAQVSEIKTQYNRALVENTNEIKATIKKEYQNVLDFKVDSLTKTMKLQ